MLGSRSESNRKCSRKVPDEAPETPKIDLRRVQNRAPGRSKMASSKPLGDRSAPAGRQDPPKPFPGQLSERSWRLLGPSRGAQGAFWDRLGPSRRSPGALERLLWRLREAILPRYFGGHIREVRKLIDFVVSDSFGGVVLILFFCFLFLPCQGARRPRPRRENLKKHIRKTWLFVGRKAYARF